MSYLNPVFPGSCPDPFVLKYCGEYYCYSTGWAPDGRVFEILHSRNLIEWQSCGGAMEPLPGGAPEYWAPEVMYDNGRFYLYYSVGDGVEMRLRAAVAEAPTGPFHDSGRQLSNAEFAIDAHVFEDDDGSRYLFYAVDFLEHTHIGTGIVRDRMVDELTIEGNPQPVALPRFDWQVFDPYRIEKGGVRWHTVEGPFVLKYKGCYYQMFSGGNWKNITYGVSYALSESINLEQEWTQLEHDESRPLVLSTIPGKVIGPGHNSVVRGPDNRQRYCVYHRWAADLSTRLLSLDRLEWIGDRLNVLGPSLTPQEDPLPPDTPVFSPAAGQWHAGETGLIQQSMEPVAQSEAELTAPCFLIEVSPALISSDPAGESEYGIRLLGDRNILFQAGLNPAKTALAIFSEHEGYETTLPLPQDFRFSSHHLFRVELNESQIELSLDGRRRWIGRIDDVPGILALYTQKGSALFRGCEITYGFEDTFYEKEAEPAMCGWHSFSGASGKWQIIRTEMLQIDTDVLNSVIVKEHHFRQYELVINARLTKGGSPDSCYGFYPAWTKEGEGPLIRIEQRGNRPHLAWYSQQGDGAWPLPKGFDRYRAQQFRFLKCKGQLQVYLEAEALGNIPVSERPTCAALYANRCCVSFDLVRLTAFGQVGLQGS